MRNLVGAEGFEPSTSWSRTRGQPLLQPFAGICRSSVHSGFLRFFNGFQEVPPCAGLHRVAAFRCVKRARKGQYLGCQSASIWAFRFPVPGRECAASATRSVLRRTPDWDSPTEQEEAVTAKRAPVGLKKPLESRLNGVSGVDTSKIDGSAMGTARGEQPEFGVDHDPVSAFAGVSSARPA